MRRLSTDWPAVVWATLTRSLRWLLPAWLAGPNAPKSHGGSRWAKRAEWRQLGRSVQPGALHGDGVVLGWLGRKVVQSWAEDNVLLLGVQRSGKTSAVVVPTLLGWDGSLVATSTKEELVALSGRGRAERGPVWVFAPLDTDHSWITELGLRPATWNPLGAAVTAARAAELADLFTAAGKRGSSAHWYLSASNLLSALISYQRERDGDMRSVLSLLNKTPLGEYLGLSAAVEDRTAVELFQAHALTPEKEAGSIASTARSCLSLWIDERVVAATRPGNHELDLDRLLEEGGSLYLVAPTEEAERCRPLFSALLQTLLAKATARARRQGGVLNPRLLMALDEAANFTRIPRLTSYVSTGPGQGIQLLLCFHDLAQIEAAYGHDEARTIWNNCRARLLLPGQGDLRTLEQFSKAIGDETRIYQGTHTDRWRTSLSEQRTGHALVSVDELRRMTSAVLLYANAPPAELELRRWDQVTEWRALVGAPKSSRLSRLPANRRLPGKGGTRVLGILLDVSVKPDFQGLPANVQTGLTHLTNNAAALLTMISGLGIVVSLLGLVLASWTSNPQLSERSRSGLLVSIGAMAILYLGIAAANYTARLFQ